MSAAQSGALLLGKLGEAEKKSGRGKRSRRVSQVLFGFCEFL